jgi:hypothetical protein
MKKTTFHTYLDGAVIRAHNRRISIVQEDGVTKIIFDFADNEAEKPACKHECKRGKIRRTYVKMSDESMDLLVAAYLQYKRNNSMQ